MATKPSTLPVWNSGGANRTTPSGGKQTTGFTVGEQPSSSFQNWWQNLVYQWTDYLNAPVGVTTTPAQTFTAGTGVGSVAGRFDSGDNNSIPLLAVAGGASGSVAGFQSGFPGAAGLFLAGVSGLPAIIAANVAVGPGLWGTTTNPGSVGVQGTGVSGALGGLFVGNGYNIATFLALVNAGIGVGGGTNASNQAGVYGHHTGGGYGVQGKTAGSGVGVRCEGTAASGVPLQIVPQASIGGSQSGYVWVDSNTRFGIADTNSPPAKFTMDTAMAAFGQRYQSRGVGGPRGQSSTSKTQLTMNLETGAAAAVRGQPYPALAYGLSCEIEFTVDVVCAAGTATIGLDDTTLTATDVTSVAGLATGSYRFKATKQLFGNSAPFAVQTCMAYMGTAQGLANITSVNLSSWPAYCPFVQFSASNAGNSATLRHWTVTFY